MKRNYRHLLLTTVALVAMIAMSPVSYAQYAQPSLDDGSTQDNAPQPQDNAPTYTQQQLDQMLAPVALYPDQLLSQVLMASTYPLEIVEANRWLQQRRNASLRGDALAAALEQQSWDPSVKSLVPFPQIVKMLDSNLPWTEQLGDAFLADQDGVMDSVQHLRQQAQEAGHLQSTPQQTVTEQGPDIIIAPANPEVVYVPYYNPTVVYGDWAYPDYPPVYFAPPPGISFTVGGVYGFGFGIGIIAPFWGWDRWDWGHHRIDIDDDRFRRINHDRPPVAEGVWRHDPEHRHGVPYRSAPVREQYQRGADDSRRTSRDDNRNADTRNAAARPAIATPMTPHDVHPDERAAQFHDFPRGGRNVRPNPEVRVPETATPDAREAERRRSETHVPQAPAGERAAVTAVPPHERVQHDAVQPRAETHAPQPHVQQAPAVAPKAAEPPRPAHTDEHSDHGTHGDHGDNADTGDHGDDRHR